MDLPALPPRDPTGHKGTFGTVAVVGGCAVQREGAARMVGAPLLAGRGALRSGAGLVRILMPEPLLNASLAAFPWATGVALPVDAEGEIIGHEAAAELDRQLASATALVIGPGLGSVDSASPPSEPVDVIRDAADRGRRHLAGGPSAMVLRAASQEDVPVVLDADGLNLLATIPEFWREIRGRVIITPHPGEYRRLAAALGINADPVEPAARPGAAEQMAQRLGVIVVLKGAGTVVSDGHRTWVCSRGHACMATGGTGDVLSGIIGGLVAQFGPSGEDAAKAAMLAAVPEKYRKAMESLSAKVQAGKKATARNTLDLFDAARLGVEIHARAGEAWASRHGQAGLLATELADEVPGVMDAMR